MSESKQLDLEAATNPTCSFDDVDVVRVGVSTKGKTLSVSSTDSFLSSGGDLTTELTNSSGQRQKQFYLRPNLAPKFLHVRDWPLDDHWFQNFYDNIL